jgi:hypothetical protein
MFVSFALLEALEEDGRGELFLVFPKEGPSVPVDRIRDIRGFPNSREVDLGPLRFYTEDGGLKVRRIAFHYGAPVLSRQGDILKLHIEHCGLPIAAHTLGYYSLLLPSSYFGEARASRNHTETWIDDARRMLITVEIYSDSDNAHSLSVDARLRKNADPPLDFRSPGFERVLAKDIYREWRSPIGYSGISHFIRAANASLSATAPSLFLCHSSSDKEFARKLAIGLAGNGLKVWIDEAEIQVGDSLLSKIESGILGAKYLVVLLSRASVQSRWCQEELRMALARQISGRDITVLPVLIEACEVPGFLQEKKYADLTNSGGLEGVLSELSAAASVGNTCRFHIE